MTWNNHHRRAEVLREVIRTADERRDATLPMDIAGIAETFGDELALLGSLQLRWHTALSGRIDNALGEEPLDLEDAVIRAWCDAAEALPGVRLILDHYVVDPISVEMASVMTRATGKEHAMIALAAGRAGADTAAAVRAGEQIADSARAANPTYARRIKPATTLVGRIKAVLAA